MSDQTKARASGPLFATTNDAGVLSHYSTITSEQPGDQPCRLIPGHGKVVPVELVEAIEAQWNSSLNISDEWVDRVRAAIRAAREGAI